MLYDFISVFTQKKDSFEHCHLSILNSLRWYPFPERQINDQILAIGAFLPKQNQILLCPISVFFCVFLASKSQKLLISYMVDSPQIPYDLTMLYKPGIATFMRYKV